MNELKELVQVENNQVFVDSRNVAKNFGKEHKRVLEAIDELNFKLIQEKSVAEKSSTEELSVKPVP